MDTLSIYQRFVDFSYTLINNNEVIELDLNLEDLNQDVTNHISKYLAYNKDLFHLRLASKTMNNLIENTPAGKLAREAFRLVYPPILGGVSTFVGVLTGAGITV